MKEIENVISDLGLASFDQDWGIICADAARLAEFVEYFVGHCGEFDEGTRAEVMELVLASADDAIRAEPNASDAIVAHLDRAFMACGEGGGFFLSILEYWRRYWSGDQYANVGRPALYHTINRWLTH